MNTIKSFFSKFLTLSCPKGRQIERSSGFVEKEIYSNSTKSFLSISTNKKKLNSSSPLCLDQKGLTFIAPLILLITFSIGTLLIYKSLSENLKIHNRSHALLCLKEYESSKRDYILKMSRLNLVIKTAFSLRFVPPISAYAQKLHQAAKKVQLFYHISDLKNPLLFKFCPSLISASYLKNLPYKTKGKVLLIRKLDGTAPLVRGKWSELIWSKNKKILFKLDFQLEGRFSNTPQVKRIEYSKEALLNWKESFGPPSS